MLLSLASRFICNIVSHLYPAYASYKALSSPSPYTYSSVGASTPDQVQSTSGSQRRSSSGHARPYPLTERPVTGRAWTQADKDAELERWLMYWAVVGTWTGVEGVGWWLLSWIPFYSFLKCMFFLWLSLPQTQGSTVIFNTFLSPFFDAHEGDIDAALAGLRARAGEAIWNLGSWAVARIGEVISTNVNLNGDLRNERSDTSRGLGGGIGVVALDRASVPQPPTLYNPASGFMQQAYTFGLHHASRYLPVAASALMSASVAATQAVQQPLKDDRYGYDQRMDMSEPRPTGDNEHHGPTPVSYAGSRSAISNTMSFATSGIFTSGLQTSAGIEDSRHRITAGTHTGSGSASEPDTPPITSNSDGSRTPSGAWGSASGYEEISREEVVYDEPGARIETRPSQDRRTSSWFGWGETRDKVKAV